MNIKKIGVTQYGGRVYDYKEMKANEGKLNKYHFYFGDVAYNGKDYFLILEGKVVEYLRVPNTSNLNDFLNIKYLEENKMYYHLEKLNNVEVYIPSEYEEYVSVVMLVEFMKHIAKVEELGDKWYTAVRKLISGANYNMKYYNINKDLKMKKVVDGKVEYVGVEVIELAEDVYDDEYYDTMEEETPLNPYKEKTTLKEAMIVKGNKTKEKAKENMENEITYEKELDEKVVKLMKQYKAKQSKVTVKENKEVTKEIETKKEVAQEEKVSDIELIKQTMREVILNFPTKSIQELINIELPTLSETYNTERYYEEFLPKTLQRLISDSSSDEEYVDEELGKMEEMVREKTYKVKLEISRKRGGLRGLLKEVTKKREERLAKERNNEEKLNSSDILKNRNKIKQQQKVKQAKPTVKEQPQVKQEVEVKQAKPTVKEQPQVKQEVEVKQAKPTVKEQPQVKQEVEVKQDKPTVKEQPKVEQKDTTKVKPFSFNNIQEVEEYIRLKKQNRMKEQQKEVTQNNEPQGEKVELQAPKLVKEEKVVKEQEVKQDNKKEQEEEFLQEHTMTHDEKMKKVKQIKDYRNMKYEKYNQEVNNITDNEDLKNLVDKIAHYENKKYTNGKRPSLESYVNIPIDIFKVIREAIEEYSKIAKTKEVFLTLAYYIFAKIQDEITGNVLKNQVITIGTIDNMIKAPKPTNTIVKKMLGTTRKANTNKLFSNSKQIITSTHTENIEGMLYDTVKVTKTLSKAKEQFNGLKAPRKPMVGVGRGHKVKHDEKLVYTRENTVPLSIEEIILCCECTNPIEALGLLVQLKITTMNGIRNVTITEGQMKELIANNISKYILNNNTKELEEKHLISRSLKYKQEENIVISIVEYSVTPITKRVIIKPSQEVREIVKVKYGSEMYVNINTLSFEIKVDKDGKFIFKDDFTHKVAMEELKYRYNKFIAIAKDKNYNLKYYKEVKQIYTDLTTKEEVGTQNVRRMDCKRYNNLINMMKLAS